MKIFSFLCLFQFCYQNALGACIDVPVSVTLSTSTFSQATLNVGSDSIEIFADRFQMNRTKDDQSYWCSTRSRKDTPFHVIDSVQNIKELVEESKLKELAKNETDSNHNFYKRLLKIEDLKTLKDELTEHYLKEVKNQYPRQQVTLDENWLNICFKYAAEMPIRFNVPGGETKAMAVFEGQKKSLEDQNLTIYSVKNGSKGFGVDKSQPHLVFTSQMLTKKKETLRVMNISSLAQAKSEPIRTAQITFNPKDDTPDLEAFEENDKRWLANNPSVYDLIKGPPSIFKCGLPDK